MLKIKNGSQIWLYLLIIVLILIILIYLSHNPAPKIDTIITEFGLWTISTRKVLEEHVYVLPPIERLNDFLSYKYIEYPESMIPSQFYISCCLHQAGEMNYWEEYCKDNGYTNVIEKYNSYVCFTDETKNNLQELINDQIYDGKMLFFSFVEFFEEEQNLVFTVANIEDSLDSDISSFNHYLFSFIGIP